MNATAPVVARLRDPAEVIAALPYLLGFHPRDSVVAVTLRPGSPPTVGLVLRGDLPPPGEEHELVDQIRTPLLGSGAWLVLLVVVGGRPEPPPAVVSMLRGALSDAGMVVADVLWAETTAPAARWARLDRPADGGALPDATCGPLAAAAAAAGLVTHADRDELSRLVAPDDDRALRRRASLLDAAVQAAELDHSVGGAPSVAHDLRLVLAAVTAAHDGRLPSCDAEVVRLAVALSEPLVRDHALSLCLDDSTGAAERLWLALTRATPAPEVAQPAALAALTAYLRGDGALAGMALDRALQAWPGHRLATLADRVLRNAVPPGLLRQLLADACADAALDLAALDLAALDPADWRLDDCGPEWT
ncbi:MAG TPA: DUF4192 domain-containing protein [Pseudonocardiaceae bacterium]|jgi:hypothetical protein